MLQRLLHCLVCLVQSKTRFERPGALDCGGNPLSPQLHDPSWKDWKRVGRAANTVDKLPTADGWQGSAIRQLPSECSEYVVINEKPKTITNVSSSTHPKALPTALLYGNLLLLAKPLITLDLFQLLRRRSSPRFTCICTLCCRPIPRTVGVRGIIARSLGIVFRFRGGHGLL